MNERSKEKIVSFRKHAERADYERKRILEALCSLVRADYPNAVEKIMDGYIGYGLGLTRASNLRKTFLQIEVHRSDILLYLRPIEYIDPRKRITVAPSKRGWICDRLIRLSQMSDVDYAIPLIRQSYDNVAGK